jgi:hypothetical protein
MCGRRLSLSGIRRMKPTDDIKLDAKVSDMIVNLFEGLCADLSYSDLVDFSEALAINVIAEVKGAA